MTSLNVHPYHMSIAMLHHWRNKEGKEPHIPLANAYSRAQTNLARNAKFHHLDRKLHGDLLHNPGKYLTHTTLGKERLASQLAKTSHSRPALRTRLKHYYHMLNPDNDTDMDALRNKLHQSYNMGHSDTNADTHTSYNICRHMAKMILQRNNIERIPNYSSQAPTDKDIDMLLRQEKMHEVHLHIMPKHMENPYAKAGIGRRELGEAMADTATGEGQAIRQGQERAVDNRPLPNPAPDDIPDTTQQAARPASVTPRRRRRPRTASTAQSPFTATPMEVDQARLASAAPAADTTPTRAAQPSPSPSPPKRGAKLPTPPSKPPAQTPRIPVKLGKKKIQTSTSTLAPRASSAASQTPKKKPAVLPKPATAAAASPTKPTEMPRPAVPFAGRANPNADTTVPNVTAEQLQRLKNRPLPEVPNVTIPKAFESPEQFRRGPTKPATPPPFKAPTHTPGTGTPVVDRSTEHAKHKARITRGNIASGETSPQTVVSPAFGRAQPVQIPKRGSLFNSVISGNIAQIQNSESPTVSPSPAPRSAAPSPSAQSPSRPSSVTAADVLGIYSRPASATPSRPTSTAAEALGIPSPRPSPVPIRKPTPPKVNMDVVKGLFEKFVKAHTPVRSTTPANSSLNDSDTFATPMAEMHEHTIPDLRRSGSASAFVAATLPETTNAVEPDIVEDRDEAESTPAPVEPPRFTAAPVPPPPPLPPGTPAAPESKSLRRSKRVRGEDPSPIKPPATDKESGEAELYSTFRPVLDTPALPEGTPMSLEHELAKARMDEERQTFLSNSEKKKREYAAKMINLKKQREKMEADLKAEEERVRQEKVKRREEATATAENMKKRESTLVDEIEKNKAEMRKLQQEIDEHHQLVKKYDKAVEDVRQSHSESNWAKKVLKKKRDEKQEFMTTNIARINDDLDGARKTVAELQPTVAELEQQVDDYESFKRDISNGENKKASIKQEKEAIKRQVQANEDQKAQRIFLSWMSTMSDLRDLMADPEQTPKEKREAAHAMIEVNREINRLSGNPLPTAEQEREHLLDLLSNIPENDRSTADDMDFIAEEIGDQSFEYGHIPDTFEEAMGEQNEARDSIRVSMTGLPERRETVAAATEARHIAGILEKATPHTLLHPDKPATLSKGKDVIAMVGKISREMHDKKFALDTLAKFLLQDNADIALPTTYATTLPFKDWVKVFSIEPHGSFEGLIPRIDRIIGTHAYSPTVISSHVYQQMIHEIDHFMHKRDSDFTMASQVMPTTYKLFDDEALPLRLASHMSAMTSMDEYHERIPDEQLFHLSDPSEQSRIKEEYRQLLGEDADEVYHNYIARIQNLKGRHKTNQISNKQFNLFADAMKYNLMLDLRKKTNGLKVRHSPASKEAADLETRLNLSIKKFAAGDPQILHQLRLGQRRREILNESLEQLKESRPGSGSTPPRSVISSLRHKHFLYNQEMEPLLQLQDQRLYGIEHGISHYKTYNPRFHLGTQAAPKTIEQLKSAVVKRPGIKMVNPVARLRNHAATTLGRKHLF